MNGHHELFVGDDYAGDEVGMCISAANKCELSVLEKAVDFLLW